MFSGSDGADEEPSSDSNRVHYIHFTWEEYEHRSSEVFRYVSFILFGILSMPKLSKTSSVFVTIPWPALISLQNLIFLFILYLFTAFSILEEFYNLFVPPLKYFSFSRLKAGVP